MKAKDYAEAIELLEVYYKTASGARRARIWNSICHLKGELARAQREEQITAAGN